LLLWIREAVMARKMSLWSELQRELERRQRVAAARERKQQQLIKQMVQDRERAERRAARAETAERKRQREMAHEAGAAVAQAMKEQLDERLAELRTLLTSALAKPPELSFAALKRSATVLPFDPGNLGEPLPAPVWEDFAPSPPGFLSGLVGGQTRHARALEAAQAALRGALAEYKLAEKARLRQLQHAHAEHDRMVQNIEAVVRDHNAAVDELERNFQAGTPDAVEEYFSQLLALSEYPSGFPHEYQVAYRPEPRELVIEYRLPPANVVPAIRDFRYVKTRGQIDELPRPVKEVKELYASITHQVALRTMWECFAAPATEDVVDAVVFNGIVPATNRATGQPEEVHLTRFRE
jgi:restriction system protein